MLLSSILLLLPGVVVSFHIPHQLLQHDYAAIHSTGNNFLLSTSASPNPSVVATAAALTGVPNPATFFNGNVGEHVGEVAKKIAIGVSAVLFLFAGLTYVAAAVLVPAGAQQLEIECTSLLPDIWEEYLGKLEEGQEMKDRPDLMFELGLLLNKSKADRLQQVCVTLKLAPDLWQRYQGRLLNDQELQDRPELIVQLNADVGQRAAQILRENTNICPAKVWESYESRTDNGGTQPLADRPDLLDELARELGYSDLLAAVVVCLGGQQQQQQQGGDAVIDVRTISGITEVRRNDRQQWDDDDE
mmetsp:Transcript_47597/g.51431  ORF Transcript_47597/g.51431 Transcript_47597/m.51431 type:complete len:302 (-) Transcript_47597:2104-3009(-)